LLDDSLFDSWAISVNMKRDPFKQYTKDPDNVAKLYLLMSGASILATIAIAIGTIFFILIAIGII